MKTVLVTGGAGEIGSAICEKFAANGYAVIITYNSNAAKAEAVKVKLSGENHSIFHAPNTDQEKITALKNFITEKYGKLDVLVNNAGITTPVAHDDLDGLSDEWIDKIMQTNFRGSFAMVRAMRELLEASSSLSSSLNSSSSSNASSNPEDKNPKSEIEYRSALVVNISSIAGIFGIGSNVAYCASKAALDSMTRSFARVLAPKIRVMSVSPGFVEGEYTKSFPAEFLQNQIDHTPMERFATGNDVANAVYSLAEHLTISTGSILTVDGGRLLK